MAALLDERKKTGNNYEIEGLNYENYLSNCERSEF
jgi:hypothetical protein